MNAWQVPQKFHVQIGLTPQAIQFNNLGWLVSYQAVVMPTTPEGQYTMPYRGFISCVTVFDTQEAEAIIRSVTARDHKGAPYVAACKGIEMQWLERLASQPEVHMTMTAASMRPAGTQTDLGWLGPHTDNDGGMKYEFDAPRVSVTTGYAPMWQRGVDAVKDAHVRVKAAGLCKCQEAFDAVQVEKQLQQDDHTF